MSNGDDKREDFALLRDKLLLGFGMGGFVIIALAAIFIDIKNPEIALAALTLCGTLLGAPTFLRYDERRSAAKRNGNGDGKKGT